jgi:hypothetical protein
MLYDWILSSYNAQNIFAQRYYALVRKGAAKHPLSVSLDQIKTLNQNVEWDWFPVNKRRLLDKWNAEIAPKS